MVTPANTPTTYYIDTPDVKEKCASDFKKIDKACKPEEDRSEKNRHPVLRKMLGEKRVEMLDGMASKIRNKYPVPRNSKNSWLSHCDGLWIKPDPQNYKKEISEFNEQLSSLSKDVGSAIEAQLKPWVDKVGSEIKERALEAAKDKAIKSGARSAARWGVGLTGAAAGGVGAIVTEGVATAWNIYDYTTTGYEVYTTGSAALGELKEVRSAFELAKKAQGELENLARGASEKTPTDLMADGMGVLARLNPCTRARRCLLVPYNKTGTSESLTGEGCCPGQSGHHILPDEMTKDGGCTGYTKGSAPTICAEGANNSNGSHGVLHTSLGKGIQKHRKDRLFGSETISYGKARDLGIRSIQETFPESKCDIKCLRSQLDSYYKDKCKKPLPAVDGKGKKEGESVVRRKK